MAIGVPIVGRDFTDVGQQIGWWDSRNRAVVEDNLRRKAQAEQAQNEYFYRAAEMERRAQEDAVRQAALERDRQDRLAQQAFQNQQGVYQFGTQERRINQTEADRVALERDQIAANKTYNLGRASDVEKANRLATIEGQVKLGVPLDGFDLAGLSPTDLAALKNTEQIVKSQLADDQNAIQNQARAINAELVTKRREKELNTRTLADKLKGKDLEAARKTVWSLPLEQLPPLSENELVAAHKIVKPSEKFYANTTYDEQRHQYVPKMPSYFGTQSGNTAAPARDFADVTEFVEAVRAGEVPENQIIPIATQKFGYTREAAEELAAYRSATRPQTYSFPSTNTASTNAFKVGRFRVTPR